MTFKLWESFSDSCLEVSESMEVNGKKTLDMMNQLSISEYNPQLEYCDKFQIAESRKI